MTLSDFHGQSYDDNVLHNISGNKIYPTPDKGYRMAVCSVQTVLRAKYNKVPFSYLHDQSIWTNCYGLQMYIFFPTNKNKVF